MIKVRKGNIEDLEEIILINKKTCKTTYNGIIDKEFLDNVSIEVTPEELKCKTEQILNGNARYYVAIDNNKIVGMLKLIKVDTNNSGKIPEIQALYVLQEYQKKGIGSKLVNEAKKTLKDEKFSKMQIGCIDGNPSNEFYKKIGGKFIGQRKFKLAGIDYNENVYLFDI